MNEMEETANDIIEIIIKNLRNCVSRKESIKIVKNRIEEEIIKARRDNHIIGVNTEEFIEEEKGFLKELKGEDREQMLQDHCCEMGTSVSDELFEEASGELL